MRVAMDDADSLVSARLEANRNPELEYDSGADLRAFLTKLVTDAG